MRGTKSFGLIAGALALSALVMASCSSSSSSTSSSKIPTGGTKVSGGTVSFAEPPGSPPNYIFPFDSSMTSSVDNISQLQYLLYRPLYMFGSPQSTSPTVNYNLSLAQAPQFSNNNTTAVVNLKNYKWSNGETVDASDVLFFINMLHAETSNWFDYVPGQLPDNLSSVTVNSPTQITFTFKQAYNPNWILYNQFSQITPFPKAWDVTGAGKAAGSGGCSTGAFGAKATDTACAAVYTFLNGQAGNLSTYATSPIWGVVDGPFKLASFDSAGDVTMVPNPSYSGPQKPQISQFKEVPFTTDDAEFNALVGGKVTIGYLPPQDITAPTSNALNAGPNNPRLASSYYLDPWILFGFNYGTLKFLSNGDNGAAGPIFSQLYFRQALQMLIDQPLYISKILHGYGVPTYGPVPVLPPNSLADSFEKSNPYPYDPAKAKSLLSSHGWKVVPGGTDTCIKPGTASDECGANIPSGAQLNFNFGYVSGVAWQGAVVQAEKSSWSSAGINVSLSASTFDTTISTYVPPCTSSASCSVEMGWWGGGWEYSPDFYPTGEVLFSTGAGSNSSNYSNSTADSLIAATDNTTTSLNSYEDYIAKQLPFFWQPNADYEQSEYASNLRGAAPFDPFATLFPEYFYLVK